MFLCISRFFLFLLRRLPSSFCALPALYSIKEDGTATFNTMVKKKGKSKRVTLKDKYKMQRRVVETGRKRKKQVKRDAKNGIVKHDKTKKDPGIPNSWPFKQELLNEIKQSRDREQELEQEMKEKRKENLKVLKEHQENGGTARTIEALMQQANKSRAEFEAKEFGVDKDEEENEMSEGVNDPGQASRRAYLRELKKVIDNSDVLLQVLDARDPLGSRINPSVENAIKARADKKMVLVLNKIDLVPKEVVGNWLTYLRRSTPAIAIKASTDKAVGQGTTQSLDDMNNTAVGMEGLLQLLKNYARTGGTGGKAKTTIVVGIIGYPNVGKSSIINALKRTRAVGVSPRPGFTTSMQEVVLDRNVRLLDSPGVVFNDGSAMLGNCVDADSVEDPIPAVEALLLRCNPASLVMTYNIPAFPPGNVMMFLAMVARSYGRVLKGGVPDKIAAARAVLRDWNSGKIPYYTPAPKDVPLTTHNDALIVSQFAKAFDISKYDDALMKTLKDKDEMDFVELDQGAEAPVEEMTEKAQEVLDFLSGKTADDGEEEVDEDEDDDDDEGVKAPHMARKALAAAEDYDFDEM
jgi:nuclear GTP-binding protein